MLSIYQTANSLIENNIWGWEYSFKTSCKFAEEAILVVNKSKDGTREAIQEILKDFDNYKIIDTDLSTNDRWFDGKLKNIGLKNCSQEFKLQLDGDEVPLGPRDLWDNYLFQFKFSPAQCMAIGSVNFFKDWFGHYSITHKQYLSKGNKCFRGPVIHARKYDGSIDTTMSDGCDLIFEDGSFASTIATNNSLAAIENQEVPAVAHFGYVNLQSRIDRNKKFWNEHWYVESNGVAPAHTIHMEEEDFTQEYIPCNIQLPEGSP